MTRIKIDHPKKGDPKYIVCPWCKQRVQYSRRAGHSCFKFYLNEIERNIRQMNRS